MAYYGWTKGNELQRLVAEYGRGMHTLAETQAYLARRLGSASIDGWAGELEQRFGSGAAFRAIMTADVDTSRVGGMLRLS